MSGREGPGGQVENPPESTSGGSNALSEEVENLLLNLRPRQAAAVRYYAMRGSPAFGNKKKAALMAGYSESYASQASVTLFGREDIAEAVRAVRRLSIDESQEVMDSIKELAPDARDELMSQLDIGRDLEIIDPREIFGDKLENVHDEADAARLKEINKHNKNMAHLMRERRKAAMDILAYGEGTPEQRVRMTRGSSEGDKLLKMMEELPQDRFDEIGRLLLGEETPDSSEEEPEVLEAEIVVED